MQDNQRQATLYAYLAGIIDGEGTIRIAKNNHRPTWNKTYAAHISVGMSEKKVLDIFSKTFGHNVKVRKECVPNRKTMYRWGTSGTNTVSSILIKLLPYLIAKKRQAELVLDFCSQKSCDRGSAKDKCLKCGKVKEKQGYGLCRKCYIQEYRLNDMDKWKVNFIKKNCLTDKEIQLREEFYWKVKKLNAVGAAATTNQEDTREREVIV